jgi:hypothetical protein
VANADADVGASVDAGVDADAGVVESDVEVAGASTQKQEW